MFRTHFAHKSKWREREKEEDGEKNFLFDEFDGFVKIPTLFVVFSCLSLEFGKFVSFRDFTHNSK